MSSMFSDEILAAALQLAARLQEDIPLSRTRDEHIRVTARANEAANLLAMIQTESITDNAVSQRSQ